MEQLIELQDMLPPASSQASHGTQETSLSENAARTPFEQGHYDRSLSRTIDLEQRVDKEFFKDDGPLALATQNSLNQEKQMVKQTRTPFTNAPKGNQLQFGFDATYGIGPAVNGAWSNLNDSIRIANEQSRFNQEFAFKKEQTERMWNAARMSGLATPFSGQMPSRYNPAASNDGFVNMGNYLAQLQRF